MVDLNLGNVDERETQRSERANSRELPRGKVCHTQGWTELCQGKKKQPKKPPKNKKPALCPAHHKPKPRGGKKSQRGNGAERLPRGPRGD